MKVKKNKYYAVVTGDIIKSSKLSEEQRYKIPEIINNSSIQLRNVFGDLVPFNINLFRGDSWQLLITDPSVSLRVSLYLRCLLKGMMKESSFETRMSIGIGLIDFIPESNLSAGNGDAFKFSGIGLEDLKKGLMNFVFPDVPFEEHLKIIIYLVDSISQKWSYKQAMIVSYALLGFTQKEIAVKLNITQQSVGGQLAGSEWLLINSTLLFYEHELKNHVNQIQAK